MVVVSVVVGGVGGVCAIVGGSLVLVGGGVWLVYGVGGCVGGGWWRFCGVVVGVVCLWLVRCVCGGVGGGCGGATLSLQGCLNMLTHNSAQNHPVTYNSRKSG